MPHTVGTVTRRAASLTSLSTTVTSLVTGLILTLLSFSDQRMSGWSEAGNLCGLLHDQLCFEPALQAGLPLAYVTDDLNLSVRGSLGLEDRWSLLAFGADVLIISAALLALNILGRLALRQLGRTR